MKASRSSTATRQERLDALCQVLTTTDDSDQMRLFMLDLCTPAELEAITDRWAIVPLIAEGMSYRAINERTGVSLTTIGRVARHLENGNGGYRTVLDQNHTVLDENQASAARP